MITLVSIKKAINNVLETSFPTLKLYASEITEGFTRPCIFTQIIPVSFNYDTVHFSSNKLMVVINYFSKKQTDLENIKMYDDLKRAFGMTIKVNHRSFLLQDIKSDTADGVLQFKFDLNFYDGVEITKEDYEQAQELSISEGVIEWDYHQ